MQKRRKQRGLLADLEQAISNDWTGDAMRLPCFLPAFQKQEDTPGNSLDKKTATL
jgi:hypothetical protein